MKILKHGDPTVLRSLNKFVQFHCLTCQCIFEADCTEYTQKVRYGITNGIESGIYAILCPDCHKRVIKEMSDEEVQAYDRERSQRNS